MGYTIEQIALLKTYDGSPLEDNPQMRGTFASLNGTLFVMTPTSTKMGVRLEWEWTNEPVLSGTAISDIVTCGFSAVDTNSSVIVVTAKNLSCSVNYYAGDTKLATRSQTITQVDPHGHVESTFAMGQIINGEQGWAKSGYFIVYAAEEVTVNRLYSVNFKFGYGHQILTSAPSISVSFGATGSGGIGLTFGKGTENMFEEEVIVRINGNHGYYS